MTVRDLIELQAKSIQFAAEEAARHAADLAQMAADHDVADDRVSGEALRVILADIEEALARAADDLVVLRGGVL